MAKGGRARWRAGARGPSDALALGAGVLALARGGPSHLTAAVPSVVSTLGRDEPSFGRTASAAPSDLALAGDGALARARAPAHEEVAGEEDRSEPEVDVRLADDRPGPNAWVELHEERVLREHGGSRMQVPCERTDASGHARRIDEPASWHVRARLRDKEDVQRAEERGVVRVREPRLVPGGKRRDLRMP